MRLFVVSVVKVTKIVPLLALCVGFALAQIPPEQKATAAVPGDASDPLQPIRHLIDTGHRNPSVDSGASTDAGGCYGIPPFSVGRGTKAPNPRGAGEKPPQAAPATKASF
jgi:hypothetical protein